MGNDRTLLEQIAIDRETFTAMPVNEQRICLAELASIGVNIGLTFTPAVPTESSIELECICHKQEHRHDPDCPRCNADIASSRATESSIVCSKCGAADQGPLCTEPCPMIDSIVLDDEGLVARANVIVERLMELEGVPYFADGRGPSPVHEIRALILALTRTLADERKKVEEREATLLEIIHACEGECPRSHDAIKQCALASLSKPLNNKD